MKTKNKIFISIIALGSLIAIQGCEKILDIDAKGGIVKDTVFSKELNVRALLNSTYTVLGSANWYGGKTQQFNDLLGDEFFGQELGSTKGEIYNRNTSVFNSDIGSFFKEPYIAVQRANQVLENLDIISPSFKDNAEGQAKFI